jgi:WD40 repeat protein
MFTPSSGSIRVWHAEHGTIDRDLFDDVEGGKLLAISPQGDYFAAVTGERFAHLFRFPSFSPATTIRLSPQCWDVKFTPQGRHLVAASGIDGTFVLTVPELNVQWQMLPDQGNSRLLAISPDGRIVANLYGDGLARLWDLATGRELFSPTPRLELANWIEFTSPTRLVISCGPRDSSEPGTQHLYVLNAQPPITKNVSRNPPQRKDFDVNPWRPVDVARPAPVGKDARRPQQRLVDR